MSWENQEQWWHSLRLFKKCSIAFLYYSYSLKYSILRTWYAISSLLRQGKWSQRLLMNLLQILKIVIQIVNYRFEQKSLCISVSAALCSVCLKQKWEGKGTYYWMLQMLSSSCWKNPEANTTSCGFHFDLTLFQQGRLTIFLVTYRSFATIGIWYRLRLDRNL